MRLTMADRAAAYIQRFPAPAAAWPRVSTEGGHQVLYATWLTGNDYRNRGEFYGAYPPGYLPRVHALFPDIPVRETTVLHVFSGSLPKGPYLRCDLRQPADFRCDVLDLPQHAGDLRWPLLLADPPYGAKDAQQYGTPMISRLRVTRALAQVAPPGGFLVWLDTCWPQHRADEWRTVGRITLIRSTNHRVRLISIFERQEAPC